MRQHGLKPIARILSFADHAQEPERFTTAPTPAVRKALARAGMGIGRVDYFELNEAFAAVALANCKLLGLKEERVNAHGGAIALGHPLGATGTRLLLTLVREMEETGKALGCASACIGGGQGIAMILERA